MSARAWCFTLNNPEALPEPTSWPNHRYTIFSEEVGDSGTYHLQGYVEFDATMRLSALKKLPGMKKAHWERRHGTREEAREYCRKKDDTHIDGPYEFGTWRAGGAGRRNDITAFKEAIDSGKTDLELWDSHPSQLLRYMSSVAKIRLLKQSAKRTWPMEVLYLLGPPGLGKSKEAMDLYPQAYWVSRGRTGVWWDGYTGESEVILDDLDASWFTWGFLLRLLDRYPMNVESKGGSVPFLAKTIVITSNRYPWELYKKERFPLPALFRRITKIILYGKDHSPLTLAMEALFLHVNGMALQTWLDLPANFNDVDNNNSRQ